jgi:hypothetical protein
MSPAQTLLIEPPVLCVKGTPRPKDSDPEVIEAAARRALPHVMRWLGKDADNNPEEEVLQDLIEVVSRETDCYRMAERLENRHHWECDSELVDILGYADAHSVRRDFEQGWVKASGIRPTRKIGQWVQVVCGWPRKPQVGQITAIDERWGYYTVTIPALGHIDPRDRDATDAALREKGSATSGYNFAWEEPMTDLEVPR